MTHRSVSLSLGAIGLASALAGGPWACGGFAASVQTPGSQTPVTSVVAALPNPLGRSSPWSSEPIEMGQYVRWRQTRSETGCALLRFHPEPNAEWLTISTGRAALVDSGPGGRTRLRSRIAPWPTRLIPSTSPATWRRLFTEREHAGRAVYRSSLWCSNWPTGREAD
jgi:hypothetical protein